jgi:hypothetical protein
MNHHKLLGAIKMKEKKLKKEFVSVSTHMEKTKLDKLRKVIEVKYESTLYGVLKDYLERLYDSEFPEKVADTNSSDDDLLA